MFVTDDGMLISVSDLQRKNAYAPIVLSVSGRLTDSI